MHRLKMIRCTLECSDFFNSHEVIGSSLLFVHDHTQASIWMIDFAKTVILPNNVHIDHSSAWSVGNHEDGYLIGINNMISIFEEITAKREAAENIATGTDALDASQSDSANVTLCGSPVEVCSDCDEFAASIDNDCNDYTPIRNEDIVPSDETPYTYVNHEDQIGQQTDQMQSMSLANK